MNIYDYEIKKHKEQLRKKSENIRPLLLDRLSEKDMIKIMFDDFCGISVMQEWLI